MQYNDAKELTRFIEFKLRPPVCSISLILSKEFKELSNMENYNRKEI